ncbi:MAG: AraC-like DNA-binding protein [Oleiphilaceae bacterium]|jgi:AraC-like DNA-binding protein
MTASAQARSRYFLRKGITPKYTTFQHDAPSYVKNYGVTFKVPISFNQKTTAIVFERKLLDSKIKLNNPHLLNVLIDYAEKLLNKITTKDNIKDQVRRFIKHKLEDNDVLDVNLAAKKLNMSRHTLYRKLKKEGVSFQSLAEEVRQAKAKHYLQENNISIIEVAYLLRFSELSAFVAHLNVGRESLPPNLE